MRTSAAGFAESAAFALVLAAAEELADTCTTRGFAGVCARATHAVTAPVERRATAAAVMIRDVFIFLPRPLLRRLVSRRDVRCMSGSGNPYRARTLRPLDARASCLPDSIPSCRLQLERRCDSVSRRW